MKRLRELLSIVEVDQIVYKYSFTKVKNLKNEDIIVLMMMF